MHLVLVVLGSDGSRDDLSLLLHSSANLVISLVGLEDELLLAWLGGLGADSTIVTVMLLQLKSIDLLLGVSLVLLWLLHLRSYLWRALVPESLILLTWHDILN